VAHAPARGATLEVLPEMFSMMGPAHLAEAIVVLRASGTRPTMSGGYSAGGSPRTSPSASRMVSVRRRSTRSGTVRTASRLVGHSVAAGEPWWQVAVRATGSARIDWNVKRGSGVVWSPRTLIENTVGSALSVALAATDLMGGAGPSYAGVHVATRLNDQLWRAELSRGPVARAFDRELPGMIRELEQPSGQVSFEPDEGEA
jgi:hypothetical protein